MPPKTSVFKAPHQLFVNTLGETPDALKNAGVTRCASNKEVAQAAEICLRLADEPAPPEPKFRAFLTALLKDWPSEQTLTGPDDPRVPVSDGCPLRALDHLDVARLSLRLPTDGG